MIYAVSAFIFRSLWALFLKSMKYYPEMGRTKWATKEIISNRGKWTAKKKKVAHDTGQNHGHIPKQKNI